MVVILEFQEKRLPKVSVDIFAVFRMVSERNGYKLTKFLYVRVCLEFLKSVLKGNLSLILKRSLCIKKKSAFQLLDPDHIKLNHYTCIDWCNISQS